MRRASRVDGNHESIIRAFRSLGCKVFDTSRMGGGYPDLNVAHGLSVVLVEVKDGSQPPSKQRLTEDEEAFHAHFPVEIVRDMDDVVRVVNQLNRREASRLREVMTD